MELHELIKKVRFQMQMTQSEFATAMHVSFSTINRWENQKAVPNKIARILLLKLCEEKKIDPLLIREFKEYQ
ncbi:helix-turn-helix domain-containing protein [Domibacillus epiphyticus]|uniref:HTH cro/C1-type domain-containing protein n=1 Tax=Domibacillus epiphyticus TaxID=1714355 RepID=A0A1V2ACG4_9BACI|nr:helix-turn-helix transcriptional regulator [Domibacillus epiphyticus]OMP68688.1 hypothetical protein BTO28_01160 [Domibacillus epiphyticus]